MRVDFSSPLLADLNARRRVLCRELAALDDQIKAEQMRLIADQAGIGVGSTIRITTGFFKGQIGTVEAFDTFLGELRPVFRPYKNDGQPSKQKRTVFDGWEKVEA